MRPWVVIPAFNEAPTIGRVVAGARRHAPVVVVDDGSRDATGLIAADAGAEVVRHARRRGKGRALLTGIATARAHAASVVVTLDADGQHDPDDIPRVLEAARYVPRAIVIGSRLMDGHELPLGRLNAIRVAGFFLGWINGRHLRDNQSGFRAYPMQFFDEVRPRRGGFVFETEVLIAAAAHAWDAHEIPIRVIARADRRSRFRPLRDGGAIGVYLAVHALRQLRAEVRVLREGTGWDPRRRSTARVLRALAAAPFVLGFLLIQALADRWVPDVVTPLVHRLYSPTLDVFASGEVRPSA